MSISNIFNAVLDFDEDEVVRLVKEEITKGTGIGEILNDGLIGAMDEVGKRFSEGNLFVPEMLKAGLDQIKPLLKSAGTANRGTIIIGTVKGDLHDIGKNLVSMMMEGAGFEVVDLGVDVDTDMFLKTAQEKKADIICMSALLTTTMPAMEAVCKAIKEGGVAVKTMVGGAPVTQAFADQIGATGFSEDAPGAVDTARKLLV